VKFWRSTVPRGWFLPVSPAHSDPTIGGCVACDVHGKKPHVQAALPRRPVRWVVTADGQAPRLFARTDADLYWATGAAWGQTRSCSGSAPTQPIESAWMRVHSQEDD